MYTSEEPGTRLQAPGDAVGYAPPITYDEDLAVRIRQLLGGELSLTEKKMFGELAFLIGGKATEG
jgi:hypothetical protein